MNANSWPYDLHFVAAVAAFVALMLYADRVGWLASLGDQGRWALTTRISTAALLLTVFTAFMELGVNHAPFQLRHWGVFLSVVGMIVGHIGMKLGKYPPAIVIPVIPAVSVIRVIDDVDANVIPTTGHEHDGEPCTHPACLAARQELRRLASLAHPIDHA